MLMGVLNMTKFKRLWCEPNVSVDNWKKTKCPLLNKGPRNNIPSKRMLQNMLDEVYSIPYISTFCHFRCDREKTNGEAMIVSQFFKNVESNV